jgi:predicted PurR-regulated permease PerM
MHVIAGFAVSSPCFSACDILQWILTSENYREVSGVMMQKLSEKKWFNGAVIACIGVAFYVILTHIGVCLKALGTFIGFFKPVLLGMVFAYVMSPLAKFFYHRVFRKMKLGKTRWYLSVVVTVVLTLLALFLLLGTLIPQLLQSLKMFSENFDSYARSLILWLEQSPLSAFIDTESLGTVSENAMSSVSSFVKNNAGNLLSIAASSGKNILTIVIALILAVYMLIDSRNGLVSTIKFIRLILPKETYEVFLDFILRCDTILVNYIVQSLLDGLIVGAVNAIFMAFCRMPYIGLVSVVVGITNLIPNFGPVIGCVIGGFILLLVDPMQAVMFIIFTLALQFVDGYIIKPRLFANSLGVSGLLILISTIVLGNMFGIPGILLSIPAAAVFSFVYNDYFVPWKEGRKNKEHTEAL